MSSIALRISFILLVNLILTSSALAAINETGDTTLTITSSIPSISTVELNDISTGDNQIDLNPATVRELNCWGTATDPDGLEDINSVWAVIYGATSSPGAADFDDDHYTNNSCDYDNSTGNYNCTFPDVQFYAVNGTWTCLVNVSDFSGNTNTSNDTASISELLAIDIPDATEIDFGSVAVGTASGEHSVTVENEGNVPMDIDVDAYRDNNNTADTNGMNCSVGFIPTTNFNTSLTSGSSYIMLLGPSIQTLDADFAEATGNGQVPTTDIVYLVVEVPSAGVAGDCDGTIFFGASTS